MILRIYGVPAPSNVLVFIDVYALWKVFAT